MHSNNSAHVRSCGDRFRVDLASVLATTSELDRARSRTSSGAYGYFP